MRDKKGRFKKGNIEPKRNRFPKGNKFGVKHGLHGHPVYRLWRRIINRCENTNYHGYHRYGGRGISVCGEWRNDFTNFYDWAKDKLNPSLQIDRIDNDGNYSPKNCRFVDAKTNMHNQPRTVYVEIKGERLSTHEASQKYQIVSSLRILRRIKSGWSDEDAVLMPKNRIRNYGKARN